MCQEMAAAGIKQGQQLAKARSTDQQAGPNTIALEQIVVHASVPMLCLTRAVTLRIDSHGKLSLARLLQHVSQLPAFQARLALPRQRPSVLAHAWVQDSRYLLWPSKAMHGSLEVQGP